MFRRRRNSRRWHRNHQASRRQLSCRRIQVSAWASSSQLPRPWLRSLTNRSRHWNPNPKPHPKPSPSPNRNVPKTTMTRNPHFRSKPPYAFAGTMRARRTLLHILLQVPPHPRVSRREHPLPLAPPPPHILRRQRFEQAELPSPTSSSPRNWPASPTSRNLMLKALASVTSSSGPRGALILQRPILCVFI